MSGQQVVHILSATTILPFSFFFRNILSKYLPPNRVADVATDGHQKIRVFYQRKDPKYTLLLRNFSIVAIYALFERLS